MLTRLFAIGLLALGVTAIAQTPAPARHSFAISGNDFLLDSKKFVIISGELHYPRVPRAYWRDRMRKMRSMGLNTLTTYVFWNAHEALPGQFDFSGDLDVAEFVRTAQEEGLWVILRPGPYVCAEWDFGGFPSWLLRDPALRIRQNDPKFLAAARNYMREVGKRLAPLQIAHGGPILMVQVENEYGSFGHDHDYMNAIRSMIRDSGFDGQLYTADGSSAERLAGGTFPDLPIAINFGNEEEPAKEFANLEKFRPTGPLMCGEFWAGWFDTWGEKHSTTPVERAAGALEWMLSRGISVSLYMIHGGTSFGFRAGADFRKAYMPDTTSYDYDSPIDEAGRPTPKFAALRAVISRHLPPGTVLPDLPAPLPMISIPRFDFREARPLTEVYGAARSFEKPPAMADLNQAHGIIVYRTKVPKTYDGPLEFDRARDYAQVYINGRMIGALDRRLDQHSLDVHLEAGATLEVLVDVMGHVNFGPQLMSERKGVAGVSMGGVALTGWDVFSIPLTVPPRAGYRAEHPKGPAFYRATFELKQTGDSYLNASGWGKGYVWVNGHNLGRYWRIGPQQSLYVPAEWLNKGRNEVVVLDLDPSGSRSMEGVTDPIWANQ